MPKVCRATGSGSILALLLLLLSAALPAEARPRTATGHRPDHAWDRDVGHRRARRPTRSERKRLRFTKKKRDVPFTAAQAEQRIEALCDDARARVQLLGRGDHRCRRSGEEHFAPAFQTVHRLLQRLPEGRRVLVLNLGLWCNEKTQDDYCTQRGNKETDSPFHGLTSLPVERPPQRSHAQRSPSPGNAHEERGSHI